MAISENIPAEADDEVLGGAHLLRGSLVDVTGQSFQVGFLIAVLVMIDAQGHL